MRASSVIEETTLTSQQPTVPDDADRAAKPADPADLGLGDLIYALWKAKWIVILVTILTSAASLGASYFRPVTYVATVKMLLNEMNFSPASPLQSLQALVGLEEDTDWTGQALEIMHSRTFLLEFMLDEGVLDTVLEHEGIGGPYYMLSHWVKEDPLDENERRNRAYEVFRDEILQSYEDPRSSVVSVSVTWIDPEIAAHWANRIFERLNSTMSARDRARSEARIDALTAELQRRDLEIIQTSIAELIAIEINKIVAINASDQYIFNSVDHAHVPSLSDPEAPTRPLWVFFGMVFGLFAVTVIVLIRLNLRMLAAKSEG